jgi:hypothetical protein
MADTTVVMATILLDPITTVTRYRRHRRRQPQGLHQHQQQQGFIIITQAYSVRRSISTIISSKRSLTPVPIISTPLL